MDEVEFANKYPKTYFIFGVIGLFMICISIYGIAWILGVRND